MSVSTGTRPTPRYSLLLLLLDPDKSLNCLPKLARAVAGMRVPAAGHCEPASGPHLSSIIAPSFGLVLFSPELGGV